MDDYKTIETKLRQEIAALTSAVTTSLICEVVSDSSYILEIQGKQYVLTSEGVGFWRAGSILAIFLLLWMFFSIVVPFILRIKKRLSYDKIKRVNAKELIKTLDTVKESIAMLYPILCDENRLASESGFVRIQNRNLAKTIMLLHRKFLPNNKKIRKAVEGYFRNADYSSVITIDKKISNYEFSSCIVLLKKMVANMKTTDCDELLEKDCIEMEEALDELDALSDRVAKAMHSFC